MKRAWGRFQCWRGIHAFKRVEPRWLKTNEWTITGTNAKCERCHHYAWTVRS